MAAKAAPKKARTSARPAKARKPEYSSPNSPSKIDAMIVALRAPKGASIAALMKLTGWQQHSVRGAIAGAIKKKRGLSVTSSKVDDQRIYRIGIGK